MRFKLNIWCLATALACCLWFGCDRAEKRVVKTKDMAETEFEKPDAKVYANERFKDVRAVRVAGNEFKITGKAQVFEAAFSWVIEDGHNELQQGHETTDAGAPEWGNFDFTVNAVKQTPNSTLHLVLFEASAKDGSRQHQLPIPLY